MNKAFTRRPPLAVIALIILSLTLAIARPAPAATGSQLSLIHI